MKRTACGCEVGDETPGARFDESRLTGAEQAQRSPVTCSLGDAAVGSTVRIVGVSAPGVPALARRLEDLGLVPGSDVVVLRRAPLGDPVVYRVCDYELCLRRAQAQWVRVAPPASGEAAAA